MTTQKLCKSQRTIWHLTGFHQQLWKLFPSNSATPNRSEHISPIPYHLGDLRDPCKSTHPRHLEMPITARQPYTIHKAILRACRSSHVWVLSHFSPVKLFSTPPGFSVHGILQVRILEWVAMHSSRESSRPRDQTYISYVSCIECCSLQLPKRVKSTLVPSHSPWYFRRQGHDCLICLSNPLFNRHKAPRLQLSKCLPSRIDRKNSNRGKLVSWACEVLVSFLFLK